jgi:hypothetical protein
VSVTLLAASTAEAQPGLRPPATARATATRDVGLFGGGFSIDLLDVGSVQALSSHGHAVGLDVGVGLQLERGRWALRLPIEFGAGGFGHGAGYAELAIIPGALYHVDRGPEHRWVPYLGGGLRFGAVDIGRTLVGLPLGTQFAACCHDWDWGDGDGGGGDPDTESDGVAASPELWAGFDWNPRRWFSLHIAGALAYERVLATDVIVARETMGMRFSF